MAPVRHTTTPLENTFESRTRPRFPGDWRAEPAVLRGDALVIAGHEVMCRWETDYMRMLADIATRNGGHILELGFGLGLSCGFILGCPAVQTHTVIEAHPDVLALAHELYPEPIRQGRLRVLSGFWEDVVSSLPSGHFDGILFDTYPLSEEHIDRNHFWFFGDAHRLLRTGGVFTYYSDEEGHPERGPFAEEHLRHLRTAGFSNIDHKMCAVAPPPDCMYWNKTTLVAPVVVK